MTKLYKGHPPLTRSHSVLPAKPLKNFKNISKKAVLEDRERVMMNNKIIKSIVEISKRKPQYVDILDKRVHGQNIYNL